MKNGGGEHQWQNGVGGGHQWQNGGDGGGHQWQNGAYGSLCLSPSRVNSNLWQILVEECLPVLSKG